MPRLTPGPIGIVGRSTLDSGAPAFGDFYHQAMRCSWPRFFAGSAAIFSVLNALFALAYAACERMTGAQPIANAHGLLDLFFFSVETLATVGFGDMHPQTAYAHVVTTFEIFTGMTFLAVMTGLIFARFSRPRARLVFAKCPVVSRHERQPTLMIRVANARANMIADASAQLWLVRNERSSEGVVYRRFHRLALVRQENPVFVLSWTLLHTIDEASLLFGQGTADLAACDARFVLVLRGLDENAVQELRARQTYDAGQIRWGHRYADVLEQDATGAPRINYARFHDVVAEPEVT